MRRTITLDEILANTKAHGDCQVWSGTVRGGSKKHDGTGSGGRGLPQLGLNGKKVIVTRLVWDLTHRKKLTTEDGVVHVQECEHTDCVNPKHLCKVPRSKAWQYRKRR